MATTYISRTPSSNGSDTISTFSAWLKKTVNGSYEGIFTSYSSTSEYFEINFESGDALEVRAKVSNSYVLRKITTRKFRDPASWYHIVVAIDTTDGTAEDRCKIYVNGVRETSFSTNTNPSSSQDLNFNTTSHEHRIGRDEWSTPAYFDGYMSHIHWTDGYSYAASTFGETDATTGEWIAKTSPSVTYGTNGFFLKFEDSSNLDKDSSSNNHTFTTSGNLIQSEDTPDNNFCTMNPLENYYQNGTFAEGNTTITYPTAGGYYSSNVGTIGMTAGKFYWEQKPTTAQYTAIRFGISSTQVTASGSTMALGVLANDWGYFGEDGEIYNNNSGTSYGATYDEGDIIIHPPNLQHGYEGSGHANRITLTFNVAP